MRVRIIYHRPTEFVDKISQKRVVLVLEHKKLITGLN